VNLRDFGQPWIPTGEQPGLQNAHRGDRKRFVVRVDEKLTACGTRIGDHSRDELS